MSVITYSSCRIQFISNDKKIPKRDYSERSVVELLQYDDIKDYSLRAIDIENNKAEIFNFRIKDRNQYRFGVSRNEPDEINDSNGTYRVWLNGDLRSFFHATFSTVLEVLFPDQQRDKNSKIVKKKSSNRDSATMSKSNSSEPINCDIRDIFLHVHNLGRSIQQGNNDEAARLATQLTSQGVRIQGKSFKKLQNEKQFRILVQIDGNEYGIDQNGGTIPIEVFPSTTIRELRAAFERAYHYSPINQYLFVNGQLVHDDSNMAQLKVGPNSLFVLFLLTHSKKSAWKCAACFPPNQQNHAECILCLASRLV